MNGSSSPKAKELSPPGLQGAAVDPEETPLVSNIMSYVTIYETTH